MKCLICICLCRKRRRGSSSSTKSTTYKPKILIVVSESNMTARVLAYSHHSIVCACALLETLVFLFGLISFLPYNVMCTASLYIGLCFLVLHFFHSFFPSFAPHFHLSVRQSVQEKKKNKKTRVHLCMCLILNLFILVLNWLKPPKQPLEHIQDARM